MSDDAELSRLLEHLGEDPLPGERDDAELIAAALAGFAEAPRDAPLARPLPSRSRVGVLVGVALAVAAAVLLGWWLLPRSGLLADQAAGSRSMAPSIADDDAAGGRAVERSGAAGRTTPREPVAALVPDEPENEIEIAPEPEPAATTDHESTTSSEPATNDTESSAGPVTPSRRPPLARAADELLEQAQRHVSEGRRAAAISSYERLVERFPESREALAARVSLGRLELDRGRAKQALVHFDAYLARSAGALVEEASYGRIRALRQLGRREQELRSIEGFLADHAHSLYEARLRKRAEELRTP